jgi:tetratricopeptide (TPR) repeat protein
MVWQASGASGMFAHSKNMNRRFDSLLMRSLVLVFFALSAWPGTALSQQNPADQAAAQALELFNSGRNEEAAAAYEQLLKSFPTAPVVPEAQFRLGYLYFVLGKHDESIELLKKTLVPPASPEVQELGSGDEAPRGGSQTQGAD